jgi:hypothetical protein
MNANGLLNELQLMLAQITDVPVHQPVTGFHLAERNRCSALLGRELEDGEDEQLLLCENGREVALSVYVDAAVMDRLSRHDPMMRLGDSNLADYCTAMEGVSHFHYLEWSIRCGRQLSLLELELQAEVDKYAVAICLQQRQGNSGSPGRLWRRLFDRVSYVAGLDAEQRQRYQEANRHAAHFCQQLEYRYLQARRCRPEAWLRALREFYRSPHHQKLRRALQ